jgi:hypothetical protein
VEGNIGAGKTTWLDMVQSDTGADHELIEVVPEPVHVWQNSPQGHNFLNLFYEDPAKYAFAFQQFVLVTRMQQVCFGDILLRSIAIGIRLFPWVTRLQVYLCSHGGSCSFNDEI